MFELINNKLNNKVKVIHFDELNDLKPIDEGGFGSIIKATWSKTNNYVACKKLINTSRFKCDDDKLSAFIYELKIQLHLNYSNRIIRFLGISQDIITEHTNNSDPDSKVGNSIQLDAYDELD
ncbi:8731_t:CDS:2, partial [Funneliformis mosseae]